ncbi:acyl-CoA thioesterase [Alcanivorax sp. S6407]|uniref:acyl-CoA thioesterase n=1 Tax=Alcanivorax sp. S6407 TaxID=2926424 RepID=UPI001FF3975D|nr:thioesterase family protein [Alcanivorax sp. S6407]MCK0152692.1 acyl-CoA thioesterase [Alcanivorax sp. S6407]
MINWDLANVHVLEFTVPAESIDVMGHVNNTEYLRFMEQIAWDHTTVLGLGWDIYQSLNRAMVARRTEVDYLAPAFEGEKLVIGTWIVENDQRLSITRRYQIIRESDGVTLLRGRTQWVCVALDSGRPKRMPPEFVQGYKVTAREA